MIEILVLYYSRFGATEALAREVCLGIDGVRDVNFQGLFDKDGRLMAVATHNSDIGDGWEREREDIEFFEEFSTKSYAIGVNIIIYALTH